MEDIINMINKITHRQSVMEDIINMINKNIGKESPLVTA